MILVISICREKLHEFEFVKPIEDILKNEKIKFFKKHYSEISINDLERADKIIICGTSLKDNYFVEEIDRFEWIKELDKPILGICGGMQIIGILFGGKLLRETEIGFFKENFKKNFFGLIGEQEVYHLHNYYCLFNEDFEVYAENHIPQAVKHLKKELSGVLFHPEVRQKHLIINFTRDN